MPVLMLLSLLMHEPATNDVDPTEPVMITFYLKYGTWDEDRGRFKRSKCHNITRPEYKPRPGHHIRLLDDVPIFGSHTKRKLKMGRLRKGARLEVNRVVPQRPKYGVMGYAGHPVWIEITMPQSDLARILMTTAQRIEQP